MSDRERPLHCRISLRAMHFASELSGCQRYHDEAAEKAQAAEWRFPNEGDAEYGRRLAGYLLEHRLGFLHGGRYLVDAFHADAPLILHEPIHSTPAQYFEDQFRRTDRLQRERGDEGH
jgi:hypothetical protein